MAYGISFYDGHALAPYKIIYLLLGALAIVVGLCVLIWLPDSPVHARVLSKEERVAVLERVREDQSGTTNKHWKKDQCVINIHFSSDTLLHPAKHTSHPHPLRAH